MRLVSGSDLAVIVAQEGALDPGLVSSLLGQAALGLDVIHRVGLIHRDVKPANFLVASAVEGGTEHVYLSDFGLSRGDTQSTMTRTGQAMGTLAYISPEQIRGEAELTAAVDVCSFGCVLYQCLTGERPFPRDKDAAAIYAHLSSPALSARAVRPELPEAVDRVIARALDKDPTNRQQTCSAVMSYFERAIGGSRHRGDWLRPRDRGPSRRRDGAVSYRSRQSPTLPRSSASACSTSACRSRLRARCVAPWPLTSRYRRMRRSLWDRHPTCPPS